MKKASYLIAFFILSLISISAHTERVTGAEKGMQIPAITLTNAHGAVNLENRQGRYLILNFWSSADVKSRMANIDFDHLTRESDDVAFVSVNLDDTKSMFEAIIKNDGVDATKQFHPERDTLDNVVKLFGTEFSMSSYLVSPSGQIVAVDPSADEICRIVSRNGNIG